MSLIVAVGVLACGIDQARTPTATIIFELELIGIK